VFVAAAVRGPAPAEGDVLGAAADVAPALSSAGDEPPGVVSRSASGGVGGSPVFEGSGGAEGFAEPSSPESGRIVRAKTGGKPMVSDPGSRGLELAGWGLAGAGCEDAERTCGFESALGSREPRPKEAATSTASSDVEASLPRAIFSICAPNAPT
jgi:hypothetical protein